MHGWVRNPKAPSSLWDGLVLDGAYAGLHPGTNRFVDGSGLENHGTNFATTWRQISELGRFATAFNGSDSRIAFADSRSLEPPADMSLVAWIRADSLASQRTVFSEGGDTSTPSSQVRGWSLFVNSSVLTFRHRAASLNYDAVCDGGALATDTLYHVACVIRASDAFFFLNGQQHGSAIAVPGLPRVHSIGSQSWIGMIRTAFWFWAGLIADPLIFRRALAPAEIEWLANPANRMYEPDTRRHFWFPSAPSARPWLYYRRSAKFIGGGIT